MRTDFRAAGRVLIAIVILGIPVLGKCQQQRVTRNVDRYLDTTSQCLASGKFRNELLIPNATDTAIYQKIGHNFSSAFPGDFTYRCMAITRNLVDTHIIGNTHFDAFRHIAPDYRRHLGMSPLVVIGKIKAVLPVDTVSSLQYLYHTKVYVEIEKIIKNTLSPDVTAGDVVMGKTTMYGYSKSYNGEVAYSWVGGVKEYQPGTSHLICFNKFIYLEHLYETDHTLKTAGLNETFCPTAFTLDLISHKLSDDFNQGKISIPEILKFLFSNP